ncbi:MAG: Nif3-like dinuclear metal center hexameric protein [Bryobacteraceae bacterium]|nr:Nif3-like dinuclear metal center hexameric protein [Bryobacteraceae bacterium]
MLIRLLLLAATTLSAQPTAREVIDRIRAQVGVPWTEPTVDTIKAGDPETPITGIATTMMATHDVLQRAAAAGLNLIITHEPTFYSHLEGTDVLAKEQDPVWAAKEKFIREHKLVVWRFHDYWHRRRPDGILQGMVTALGWTKYQNAATPALFTVPETSVETLAGRIRQTMKIRVLRVVGGQNLKVTKLALLPGASGAVAHRRLLQRDDVEALVIGEVPEWETIEYVLDASAQGKRKALILMGHVPSEQAGMENCAAWLKTFLQDVKVSFVPTAEPFWMPK